MNDRKLKFLLTNEKTNSSLVKSSQEEWLSFLLMKKIYNALKEKTLIRHEINENLDYKPATFEMAEEEREVLGCPVKYEKSVVMACEPKRILPKVPVTEDFYPS